MPCITYPDPNEADTMYVSLKRENARLEAMLCAVLTPIENNMGTKSFFNNVDWKEAGIARRDLEEWWRHHRAIDMARREREAKSRREAADREKALNKLSSYEKSLLGIKE